MTLEVHLDHPVNNNITMVLISLEALIILIARYQSIQQIVTQIQDTSNIDVPHPISVKIIFILENITFFKQLSELFQFIIFSLQ